MMMNTVKFAVVAVMAMVPTVALGGFVDTFESFTPGVTVAGQGEWSAIYGADHALVRNDAATAYAGEQYLDFWQDSVSSTFPYRGGLNTPLSPDNVASYYFRIGEEIGASPNDAFSTFFWSTGPGHAMAKTNVWHNGTITFFQPGEINSGVLIDHDKWYLFEYTYNLVDTVNLTVTDTTTSTVVLDIDIASQAPDNQTTTMNLQFNKGTYSAGSSYHSLVDNVSLTPEPATMALLSIGGLAVLARRRRA